VSDQVSHPSIHSYLRKFNPSVYAEHISGFVAVPEESLY
jgi:hypothetical protein